MLTTTLTEFMQHAKTYFDTVEEGQIVAILRHGKVIAKLVPAENKELSWKRSGLKLVVKGFSLSKEVLAGRNGKNFKTLT